MRVGAISIVALAGALIVALSGVAPAQAERSRRPVYGPPPASLNVPPGYAAPIAPARPPQVWGANGYRFDAPAGAVPVAPSPYGY
jgi:hypothetical protein